jgi:guanylate kinase
MMFVLSSPSGAGKTTLSRRLLDTENGLVLSVSVTTRPARRGEKDGADYRFVSMEDFGLMVNREKLLEHAKVFGNYYGTPREPVDEALDSGIDVLFDIDWQGSQQLEKSARDDLVRVFILPPSTIELERRLRTRAQDTDDVVAMRMSKASDEMSHWAEYDYVVINDDIEQSFEQVRSILYAERLKRSRQVGLNDFVKQLREGL